MICRLIVGLLATSAALSGVAASSVPTRSMPSPSSPTTSDATLAAPSSSSPPPRTRSAIRSAGPSVANAVRPTAGPMAPRDRVIPGGRRRRRCPIGESHCDVLMFETGRKSERCYNPSTHVCSNNLICARSTPERCGDNCYSSNYMDADSMVCHNDSVLCPLDLPYLCGDHTCYHDDEYKCENGKLVDLFV